MIPRSASGSGVDLLGVSRVLAGADPFLSLSTGEGPTVAVSRIWAMEVFQFRAGGLWKGGRSLLGLRRDMGSRCRHAALGLAGPPPSAPSQSSQAPAKPHP